MGVVCEDSQKITGMHWQQQQQQQDQRYMAYDPSRDLSPNLPLHCDSSDSSDNNNTSSACCRVTNTSLSSCKLEQEDGVVCAGCGVRISDRFYLMAVDRRWHATCLQCSQCHQPLEGEMTCFSRDGNIYCKKDYYRLFGMKRCGRCQAAISSSELVMRARDVVFHVHCFTCSVCNSLLSKGDHFGMHGPNVFCQLHYEPFLHHTPPFPSPVPADYHPSPSITQPPPEASPCALDPGSKVFFNGTPTARQKGRPRKRKPKDLESMTANIDLNADSYLDVAYGTSPGSGGSGQSQRTKRMRTSFKHHQLRTMKSYFAINHNPDAKDLKQLSQKTGLPKRVLQVWFQNARAKWRRMMTKQEGKLPPGEKGSPSDLHLHQSDYGLHMQDPSCSPHYMLSSPSLECS